MVRTQILLTEDQARTLREMAAAQDRSMAELVRDGVAILLRSHGGVNREALKRRSLEVLGRFHSGVADLGSGHDQYLDEAFGK